MQIYFSFGASQNIAIWTAPKALNSLSPFYEFSITRGILDLGKVLSQAYMAVKYFENEVLWWEN